MIKLQGVIPAVRNMKDFDRILNSKQKYIILLETRLSLLRHAVKYAQKMDKQVLVHADLIQGLKSDEFGIEFLLRDIKVDGLISTRSNVISHAKK